MTLSWRALAPLWAYLVLLSPVRALTSECTAGRKFTETSFSCEFYGWEAVTSLDVCESAARMFSLGDVSEIDSTTARPAGCYSYRGDITTGEIVFNPSSDGTDCSYNRPCVCIQRCADACPLDSYVLGALQCGGSGQQPCHADCFDRTVTSGSCESNGYQPLMSLEDCQAAVNVLEPGASAQSPSWDHYWYPTGCWKNADQLGIFSSPGFSFYPGPDRPCTSVRPCICFKGRVSSCPAGNYPPWEVVASAEGCDNKTDLTSLGSWADCQAAVDEIDVDETVVTNTINSDYPRGCFHLGLKGSIYYNTPATTSTKRCWEAHTPDFSSCSNYYEGYGYTCVGDYCAAMDPTGNPAACATQKPEGWFVNPETGRCEILEHVCFDSSCHVACPEYQFAKFVSGISTGQCETNGHRALKSTAACQVGANALLLDTKVGEVTTQPDASSVPTGCYQKADSTIVWFKPDGNNPCTSERQCICSKGCANFTECQAGSHVTGTSPSLCLPCPPAKFSSTAGQTSCTSCVVGKYSVSGPGQSAEDAACITCPSGRSTEPFSKQTNLTDCTNCTFGKYTNPPNTTGCQTCKRGYYQDEVGQTSCKKCAILGMVMDLSGRQCVCDAPCLPGAFKNLTTGDCINCKAGRYNPNAGATSPDSCSACPAGRWSDGRNLTNIDGCQLCPRGKAGSTIGATSDSACKGCIPGQTYTDEPGSMICIPSICPPGKYGDASKTGTTKPLECTDCVAGRFNPAPGIGRAEDCSLCSLGRYGSPAGSTSREACISCPSLKYGAKEGQADEGQGCDSCPRGLFQDETGRASCKPASCPPGKWGSLDPNCTECVAGKYGPAPGAGSPDKCLSCPKGRFGVRIGADALDDCEFCKAGSFGERENLTSSACSGPCPLGKYSFQGLTECLNCTAGTYHDGLDQEQSQSAVGRCSSCVAGRFQDEDGASSCKLCASGKYGSEPGRRSENDCQPLPTGSFSEAEGLGNVDDQQIQRCAPGKFGSSSGDRKAENASCELCASGQFTDKNGSDACEPCPTGTTGSERRDQCVADWTIIISVVATLLALMIPVAYWIRRRLKHQRKYALVTLGGRRSARGLCSSQWRLKFPRRSRFSRLDITEGAKLGNGAFGEVNAGTLQVGKARLPIAVKHVLESKATDAQRKETIVECRLQCELESPFVVKCFGFARYPGPGDFSILLELMDLGDLLTYMIKRTKANERIAEATRLQWMIQAASALEYLHASGLVHADVAARNLCLVHANNRIVCKLTDFGLSKRLNPVHKCYWLPLGHPMPLWWTAPECLPVADNFQSSLPPSRPLSRRGRGKQHPEGFKLTAANDVWSFGVTMWEIEAHATMASLQRPFKHVSSVAGGPSSLTLLYDELMTNKASALAFEFPQGVFATPGAAFPDPARIATNGCLRLRESERFDMAKVRRRLQDCSLCDAPAWQQAQVHEWLYQMGAPRDEQVLDSDLFASITTFEELCNELIDDNYRADYLDPEVHPGFTPELSRRIVVELKGIKDLLSFKDHEGEAWQKECSGLPAEEFAWMAKYQAAPRSARQKWRGLRNFGSSSRGQSSSRQLDRDRNESRLSELYASEGSLYTTGVVEEPASSSMHTISEDQPHIQVVSSDEESKGGIRAEGGRQALRGSDGLAKAVEMQTLGGQGVAAKGELAITNPLYTRHGGRSISAGSVAPS